VSSAGDLNVDGFDDLVVGARFHTTAEAPDSEPLLLSLVLILGSRRRRSSTTHNI
jgi:MYXO-CTERM domain-containing protein